MGQVEVQNQTPATTYGQWRFVVAWYDGTNAYIQLDDGPIYWTNALAPEPTTNPLVALKGRAPFAADELFFYKRVLAPGERSTIYQIGLRAMLSNIVEDLLFDMELTVVSGQPPEFLAQPVELTVQEGENTGFKLFASSTTPVSYQWLLNGVPISGATDPLLFLPNVSKLEQGTYMLVASNAWGAVTSPPVKLSVLSRPPVLTISRSPSSNAITIQFNPQGQAAELLGSTNLHDWDVIYAIPATTNTIYLTNLIGKEEKSFFYRVRLHP